MKKVSTYSLILISWVSTFPWFVNLGLVNIPGALGVLFSPPPYGFQPQQLLDYTIKLIAAISLEMLPLAAVLAVPLFIFRKSTQESAGNLKVIAHLLWIKSAVMLAVLAVIQIVSGNPFLTSFLTAPDTFLILIGSPLFALAALGLLKPSNNPRVSSVDNDPEGETE